MNDPDQLSCAAKLQAGLHRQIGDMVSPMNRDPGSKFSAAPPDSRKPSALSFANDAADEILAAIEWEQSMAQADEPSLYEFSECRSEPSEEISSSEWMMERNRYQRHKNREAWDFADLEK